MITFNISSPSVSTVYFLTKTIRQSTGKEDIKKSNLHFVKISTKDITSRHIQWKFVCSIRSDNCICPKFPSKRFQNKRDKTCPLHWLGLANVNLTSKRGINYPCSFRCKPFPEFYRHERNWLQWTVAETKYIN